MRSSTHRQYVDHLDDRIGILSGQIHALQAELAAVVGAFDQADGWKNWGIRSMAHWLSFRAGWSTTDAQRIARVGARIDAIPTLAHAAGRGEVSLAMLDAAARVTTPENEAAVAEIVRLCTPSQAGRVLSKYRELNNLPAPGNCIEPPSPLDGEPELWWRDWIDDAGRGRVDAALNATTLELVRQAFAAVTSDHACEVRSSGPAPTPDASKASVDELARRVAAAAIEQAQRFGSRGAGGESFAVQITVDLATLAAALGIELNSTLPVQLGRQAFITSTNGRITQLSDEQLARALCDAKLQMLVHDNGVPLWLGNEVRNATRHQRRALRHRSGGACEFPSCTATRHLEPHHIRHHEHGGATSLDNLLLLCWHHHHELHRHGWAVRSIGHQQFAIYDAEGACLGSTTAHGPPSELTQAGRRAHARSLIGHDPPPELRLIDPDAPRPTGGGEPLTAYGLDVLVTSLLLAA